MVHPDTREKLLKKKDLVRIVKVSNDTFYIAEIIPILGIILCVLSLIFYFQNYCVLCGEKHINNNYVESISRTNNIGIQTGQSFAKK